MRRLLVGQGYPSTIRLAPRLSFRQQLRQPQNPVQLAALPGCDIRQILNRAGQVGDLFFQRVDSVHHAPKIAAPLAAPPPIR